MLKNKEKLMKRVYVGIILIFIFSKLLPSAQELSILSTMNDESKERVQNLENLCRQQKNIIKSLQSILEKKDDELSSKDKQIFKLRGEVILANKQTSRLQNKVDDQEVEKLQQQLFYLGIIDTLKQTIHRLESSSYSFRSEESHTQDSAPNFVLATRPSTPEEKFTNEDESEKTSSKSDNSDFKKPKSILSMEEIDEKDEIVVLAPIFKSILLSDED